MTNRPGPAVHDDLALALAGHDGLQGFSPRLSWTHYRTLCRVEQAAERLIYEVAAERNGWSLQELERQMHSHLFLRLVKSRDKAGVMALATQGQQVERPILRMGRLTHQDVGQMDMDVRMFDDLKRGEGDGPSVGLILCAERDEVVADAINRCRRIVLVDGIRYQRLGEDACDAQELLEREELTGYLKNMLQDTQRSVYQHVVYDSEVERDFAGQLEKNDAIKVYAKLPGWFKVPTPLGSYNPDRAVLVTTPEGERLYFVVETKSSLFDSDLRDTEAAKTECGRARFKALAIGDSPAIYDRFKDVMGLVERAQAVR